MAAPPVQFEDSQGLPLTCSSQEAVDLFNKVLEDFISSRKGFYDSLKRSLDLDPGFVLAQCLMVAINLETFRSEDSLCHELIAQLKAVYNDVLDRERLHIDAVLAHSQGDLPKACQIWDNITVQYPLDMLAMRLAFGCYLEIGEFERMRNLTARSSFHCPKDSPLYPYVLSCHSFSLEENNERDKAEELSRKSIALQPKNPWGVHAMGHVIEEERNTEQGVEFLIATRENWYDSLLGIHITWHLTLYYIDLNQIDKVLEEFDKTMAPSLNPAALFPLLDTSSLLWRLNILGIDPGEERWKKVTDCFKPRVENPQQTWLDTHCMMSLSYGKVSQHPARLLLARQMTQSMRKYAESGASTDCKVAEMLGVPVCDALLAYGEERYDDVLTLLLPLKYDIIKLGGSWAQRQVFFLTLIQAAIRAGQHAQAMALVLDLKSQKPCSKLLQRLYDTVKDIMINEQ